MRRPARILLELLAPAAIASLLLAAGWATAELDAEPLRALPFLLAFAYAFAAIPSLLFTLAMEVAFSRGLDPSSGRAVRFAALLGLLGGAAIALAFGPRGALQNLALFSALGAATGALVGLLVRARSTRPPAPARSPRDPET